MSIERTVLTGGMALTLALALAACGGPSEESNDGGSADTGAVAEQVQPSAEVEPDLINPGSLNDSDNTSDIWIPSDGSTKETLYFTNAANDAGLTVTFVDEGGSEDSLWDLEVSDGHLVTTPEAGEDVRKVDIVFMDNFTCYDYETKTTYTRGDRSADDYTALFAGKTYVEDLENPDNRRVELSEDGSCMQSVSGSAIEGTWEVATPTVLCCHYPDNGYDIEFEFEVEGDAVSKIDAGGMSGPSYLYELV